MDRFDKNHASKSGQRGSEVADFSCRQPRNALEENRTLREENRILLEDIKELRRRYDELQKLFASQKEELASKKLELSRGVPVPYGSYCTSGATPQLLHRYSEKVFIDLGNFVLFSGTPIEEANSLKARVSEIFFSKFEQIDFGVKGESLFTNPGLLPEQSLTEFRAFSAYADDQEDETVKPYLPKFSCFKDIKLAKIRKSCDQVELKDATRAHFFNLAMNVWMLHKLAFSFERTNVRLMRAVRDEPFIDKFMEPVGQQDEDQLKGKPPATTTTVKDVMMPGLWINNSVIKCRVCLGSATGQEPGTTPATQLPEGDAVNGTGPRSVDFTQDKALQPTSSQVRDREASAAHAYPHAHQQTQAKEHAITDETDVSWAPHSRLPDGDLGNDKTPAVEGDQAAQEMTYRHFELGSRGAEVEPPLHPPHPMENYYDPSSAHIVHQGSLPNPYHGSAHQSKPRGV